MRVLFLSACFGFLAACGGAGGADTDPVETDAVVAELPEPEAPAIDPTGETCGGITAIQCPTAFYCAQEVGQCLEIMDGAGTCQPQPEICTREYMPVCGCDGQTYGNACEAAAAGVSIALEGECASPDTQ